MSKKMLRVFSMMLALVVALASGAFAETVSGEWAKISALIETAAGNADANVRMAYDEAGNVQITFGSETMGLNDLLLQITEEALTVGDPASGYMSVSPEELAKLLDIVNYMSNFGMSYDQASKLETYLTSEAYMEDVQMITYILSGEANRFASCATELGLVSFSEAGALTIQCDIDKALQLASAYLASLSQASDIFAVIGTLHIFEVFGVDVQPYIAELPAMLSAYASQIASLSVEGAAGKVYFNVSEAGEMVARASFSNDDVNFNSSINSNAAGMNMNAVMLVDGAEVLNAYANIGSTAVVSISSAFDGFFSLNAMADAQGFTASIAANDGYGRDSFTLDFAVNDNNGRIEMHEKNINGGADYVYTFAIDPNTYAPVVALDYNYVYRLSQFALKGQLNGEGGKLEVSVKENGKEYAAIKCNLTESGLTLNGTVTTAYGVSTLEGKGVFTENGALEITAQLKGDDGGIVTYNSTLSLNDCSLTGSMKINASGTKMDITFTAGASGLDFRMTMGGTTAQIYLTPSETANGIKLEGGVNAIEGGKVTPALKISAELLNTAPFAHNISYSFMNKDYNGKWIVVSEAKSAYNGNTWMFQMNNGGQALTLIGMPSETENEMKFTLSGNIYGSPFEAEAGFEIVSMTEETMEFKIFADAEAAMQVGIEIPVSLTITDSLLAKVGVTLIENGVYETLGTATFNVEYGMGDMQLVSGQMLTAEDLYQMFFVPYEY